MGLTPSQVSLMAMAIPLKNINMNLITSYIGLFGYNKGTIKNLTVENVTLAFTTPTQNVGILAGKKCRLNRQRHLKEFKRDLSLC